LRATTLKRFPSPQHRERRLRRRRAGRLKRYNCLRSRLFSKRDKVGCEASSSPWIGSRPTSNLCTGSRQGIGRPRPSKASATRLGLLPELIRAIPFSSGRARWMRAGQADFRQLLLSRLVIQCVIHLVSQIVCLPIRGCFAHVKITLRVGFSNIQSYCSL